MSTRTYHPDSGTLPEDAVRQLFGFARLTGDAVQLNFNGVIISVTPETDPSTKPQLVACLCRLLVARHAPLAYTPHKTEREAEGGD